MGTQGEDMKDWRKLYSEIEFYLHAAPKKQGWEMSDCCAANI